MFYLERGDFIGYCKLKQIERQLILYDIFSSNDEDTKISTIKYHLPGITIRTLQRDIRDLKDANVINIYFSRTKNAYINCDNKDIRFYSEGIQKRIKKKRKEFEKKSENKKEISPRRQKHLDRLYRLATLMNCGFVCENTIGLYFELFPNATERMRKRDFETLRHIGFCAGYDKEMESFALYQQEDYGIYDGYGIRLKNGKMVY